MSHSRSSSTASAVSATGSVSSQNRPSWMPPERSYTVLSQNVMDPFGFGSAAPARVVPKFSDTPGPGKYEPKPGNFYKESVRGYNTGFTSVVQRRLQFTRGTKNPSPWQYEPGTIDRKVKPKIGKLTGRRCSCFPDEREASTTPGPGSYDLPKLKDKVTTSVFKSRTERRYLPDPYQEPPRFDGKTFTLRRNDM